MRLRQFNKEMWGTADTVQGRRGAQILMLTTITGLAKAEASHMYDSVILAMLFTLVQRGDLQLPFLSMGLTGSNRGDLTLTVQNTKIFNDAMKDEPKTSRGRYIKSLLRPEMFHRLELLKEAALDRTKKNTGTELQDDR